MAYSCALITGASSGIGAALAAALPPATGLVLTGRNADALTDLARRLEAPDRRVETLSADLATTAGRDAVIAAGEAAGIDLLINNAGLGFVGPVHDNRPEDERMMVEVNVVAPVVLTRALLPGMLARAGDRHRRAGLIMVASAVGFFALPYMTTYAASKAFDLHYGEGLAAELADAPIDVLTLCPGATGTAFAERAGIPSRVMGGAHSAEQVAREGLAALGRRRVHVVGQANRLTTLAPRLLPRGFLSAASARYIRRWERR